MADEDILDFLSEESVESETTSSDMCRVRELHILRASANVRGTRFVLQPFRP